MYKIVGFFGIILGATLTVIERYFIHIPNVVAITLYAMAVIMIVIGVIGNRMSSNCNQRNS